MSDQFLAPAGPGTPERSSNSRSRDRGGSGPGRTARTLEPSLLSTMESAFGYAFGEVRIFDDNQAAGEAADYRARAFTIGNAISFGVGRYRPSTPEGRRLIAHELAHVVQQGGAPARPDPKGVLPSSSPREAEADHAATDAVEGRRVHITPGDTVALVARAPDDEATSAPGGGGTAAPGGGTTRSASRSGPRRELRLDILGADMSVLDSIVRAAEIAVGADHRVTSLDDMINQLVGMAGPSTDSCVRDLTIWNHGRPGAQLVAGTEEVQMRDGRKVKRLPPSAFDMKWLLSPGTRAALSRLRGVFCCGATMHWNGCGTAGVQARGGARTDAERRQSPLRYEQHGGRYATVDELSAQGATRLGATFGSETVRSWADATCTTISAATDFTYIGPGVRNLAKVGHGGRFVTVSPTASLCGCDANSGRLTGTWTPDLGRRAAIERSQALVGGDYLWHVHLRLFRELMRLGNAEQYGRQRRDALLALINDVAPRIAIPAGLPVAEPRIFVNLRMSDPAYAAATNTHLAICFPDNCWRWLVITQKAIEATPEYTQAVLTHELLHAADVWQAAQAYRRDHGNPPTNADESRCVPVEKGVRAGWKDPWGQYVNGFVDAFESGQSDLHHLEIYSQSIAPVFDRLTAQEQLVWFDGVLNNFPANLPAVNRPAAELQMERLFSSPNPDTRLVAFRDEAANLLAESAKHQALGDGPSNSAELAACPRVAAPLCVHLALAAAAPSVFPQGPSRREHGALMTRSAMQVRELRTQVDGVRPRPGSFGPTGLVQRCGDHPCPAGGCNREEEVGIVGRLADSTSPATSVPASVHQVVRAAGRPLDPVTRAVMERRLGHDFGSVRVHDDSAAGVSSRAIGARAYTVRNHVVFAAGQYRPASTTGHALLAHELVHVVQQGGIGSPGHPPAELILGRPDSADEHQADTTGSSFLALGGGASPKHPDILDGPVIEDREGRLP